MCPPLQKYHKKYPTMYSCGLCLFRHACSLKPVAKRLRPCARVLCVCVCVNWSILFICDGCSGKEAEWILVVSASRQQEPFVYSHLEHIWEKHQEIPTNHSPATMSMDAHESGFLGAAFLPVHFLFGSSQIAFHFDELWGVFLLLVVLMLIQFQLFKCLSSLHELDLQVW